MHVGNFKNHRAIDTKLPSVELVTSHLPLRPPVPQASAHSEDLLGDSTRLSQRYS